MISGMDEMNPVITPILDLSEIRRGSGAIGDILGDTPLQVGDIRANASSADSARKANLDELADILDQRGSTNITMNQVNNSPKALSPAEIYRRTNNQISKVKEALT